MLLCRFQQFSKCILQRNSICFCSKNTDGLQSLEENDIFNTIRDGCSGGKAVSAGKVGIVRKADVEGELDAVEKSLSQEKPMS